MAMSDSTVVEISMSDIASQPSIKVAKPKIAAIHSAPSASTSRRRHSSVTLATSAYKSEVFLADLTHEATNDFSFVFISTCALLCLILNSDISI